MEGEEASSAGCVADNFSFRPQREKIRNLDQQISPPRIARPQKKAWHASNKHGRGRGYVANNFPLLEYPEFIAAQMQVEDHFNKVFSFEHPTSGEEGAWQLPPADTMFTHPPWQDEELQALKESLNATKQLLSDKDIGRWHTHTSNTNPAQRIASAVKRQAQPEMVTQAWLKFYEILNAFSIVPLDTEADSELGFHNAQVVELSVSEATTPFNSVHLCEAPGAFISALNHYLALNRHNLKWQWLGSTLNPYYEGTPVDQCITEDRFICHTLNNWSFGKDNSGDLMSASNLTSILQDAKALGQIYLVTADGSFDCQANPAEQEKMTHCLHLCEVVAALSILADGGNFVVKKFTFFESETVNLMYLLCCVFETVSVYKPGTSKQGNSEVYVIAANYIGKGKLHSHLNKLSEVYGCSHPCVMFGHHDIPGSFLQQMKQCASKFMAYQVTSITRNLNLFKNMNEKEKQYNELLKSQATDVYFQRNPCEVIPKWKMVTHGSVNKSRQFLDSDWDKTWSAKLVRCKDMNSKVEILFKFLLECIDTGFNFINSLGVKKPYISFNPQKLESIELQSVKGKPFRCAESSKFCSEKVFRIYRELHHVWQNCNMGSVPKYNDSLVGEVLEEHPGVKILHGEGTIGPHPGCWALEETLVLLEEGSIANGGAVALVNVPLLTRLQCGLLLVISTAFMEMKIYAGEKLGKHMPVLVLAGLRSVSAGEAVVRALHHQGWSPGVGAGGKQALLQITSIQNLLHEQILNPVFVYNVNFCIHHSLALYHIVTEVI